MKLSIIVTHYRTPELLKLCLQSLQEATLEIKAEILVLDSESEDETVEMVKNQFPNIAFFPFHKNTGYAKIVNVGLSKAQGDFLLVLNADIIVAKDSLSKMINYLEAHSEIGVLGPQLLNFNGSIQESCFRFHRPLTIFYRRTFLGKIPWGRRELDRFAMKDFDRTFVKEVDWILGAAMMIRRQALTEVGPMDERFFLYFEDTDWCRRFWQKKWQVIYLPEVKMHHYHGRASKKINSFADIFINKYLWIHLASALKYFWKYRKNK